MKEKETSAIRSEQCLERVLREWQAKKPRDGRFRELKQYSQANFEARCFRPKSPELSNQGQMNRNFLGLTGFSKIREFLNFWNSN